MRNIADIAAQVMPPALHKDRTWKQDGDTGDIIQAILSAEKWNQDQTAALAPHLKGANTRETLRNVWFFVRNQINYKKDAPGHERVKLPAKTWADRNGDCKSMSVFIAGLLKNLGIPAKYRFVSYTKGAPITHVYVIANPKGERQVIMDAVHPKFDTEEAYSYKKDYPITMTKVSVIHGLSGSGNNRDDYPRQVAPWQNINWGKLTAGELKLAMLGQQIALTKAYYGDPTGSLEASASAVKNALYAGVHRIGTVNADSKVLPNVVLAIRKAQGQLAPAGHAFTSFRDPRQSGLIPDYIGMPDAEFDKVYKDVLSSGGCMPIKKELPWSTTKLTDPPYDSLLRNFAQKRNMQQLQALKLLSACEQQTRLIDLYNDKLRKGGHHIMYSFVKDPNVAPQTVAIKTHDHNKSIAIFGPELSGMSEENMRAFVRISIQQSNADAKIGPIQPEETVKLMIAGNEVGIGFLDPVTLTALAAVLASAGPLFNKILEWLKPSEQAALKQLQALGTGKFGPEFSDWDGFMPKTTTDSKGQPKLENDPTTASTSWILPVLIGGGALLWGAKAFKS